MIRFLECALVGCRKLAERAEIPTAADGDVLVHRRGRQDIDECLAIGDLA